MDLRSEESVSLASSGAEYEHDHNPESPANRQLAASQPLKPKLSKTRSSDQFNLTPGKLRATDPLPSGYPFPEVYSVPPPTPADAPSSAYTQSTPSYALSTPSTTMDAPTTTQTTVPEITEDAAPQGGLQGFLHSMAYPQGVKPSQRKYEHWLGRLGFGAKGLVYGFVGGMTCASASRQYGNVNGSPQGAFVLIGSFPAGDGLLVVMLVALMCYIGWRFWEALTFQGADATFSKFKNFFQYRLSPAVSGGTYCAYSYYIIETLHESQSNVCYPNCWRETALGRAGLVLFGISFTIAAITQLLNAVLPKWHPEIDWNRCSKLEKWAILSTGHVGFLGRTGLFTFVAVLMFRALRAPVTEGQGTNTIANGVNQFVGNDTGIAFMWIVGILTIIYALFALLCTRYRYFPTPPPSGKPLYPRKGDEEAYHDNIHHTGIELKKPHRQDFTKENIHEFVHHNPARNRNSISSTAYLQEGSAPADDESVNKETRINMEDLTRPSPPANRAPDAKFDAVPL